MKGDSSDKFVGQEPVRSVISGWKVHRRCPSLSYVHRITIPSQPKPTKVRWSVRSRSVVTAKYSAAGGATGKASWLRKAVAHRGETTVAPFGHHTPLRFRSGLFSVNNHTGHPKHDIEFNGVIRFHGKYATTRCAGADSHGTGHVQRRHGSWVTFEQAEAEGLLQCGAGGDIGVVGKAGLKHCKS
jgi:hypothetical protein